MLSAGTHHLALTATAQLSEQHHQKGSWCHWLDLKSRSESDQERLDTEQGFPHDRAMDPTDQDMSRVSTQSTSVRSAFYASSSALRTTRRQFVVGISEIAGGLVISADRSLGQGSREEARASSDITAWVVIRPDDDVII